MLKIEKDNWTGGLRLITEDKTYVIWNEIEWSRNYGHGGGHYVSDVHMHVKEEDYHVN